MEIFIAGEKVTRPHKQLIIFKCHFFLNCLHDLAFFGRGSALLHRFIILLARPVFHCRTPFDLRTPRRISGPKISRFFEDELLQSLFWQVIEFHLKLERLLRHGLVFRVVVLLQVGMGKGFLHL